MIVMFLKKTMPRFLSSVKKSKILNREPVQTYDTAQALLSLRLAAVYYELETNPSDIAWIRHKIIGRASNVNNQQKEDKVSKDLPMILPEVVVPPEKSEETRQKEKIIEDKKDAI